MLRQNGSNLIILPAACNLIQNDFYPASIMYIFRNIDDILLNVNILL